MKNAGIILAVVILAAASVMAQGGSIYVSYVDGEWQAGNIIPDCGHGNHATTVYVHYTNNTGGFVGGMANGFVVTGGGPDLSITAALLPGPICSYFDLVCQVTANTAGPNIVSAGFSKMMSNGLPDGFSEDVFTISISGVDNGETVCLDSTYFPPVGTWLWQPGGSPSWGGPYCYTAMMLPCGVPSFTNFPSGPLVADHCLPSVSYQFEAEDLFCGTNYWFYLVGGVGTIDTVTGLWSYSPSLADVGAPLSVSLETCNEYCNCSGVQTMEVIFTNMAPEFTAGPGTYFALDTDPDPLKIPFEGQTLDCDPSFSMALVAVDPTPSGSYSFVQDTLTFDPVAADLNTTFHFDLEITDGKNSTFSDAHVSVISFDCCDLRGDIDHNGVGPDIADVVYLVTYMFAFGPMPPCFGNADIDGDLDGPNITDLVHLVTYMFSGGEPPVPCP